MTKLIIRTGVMTVLIGGAAGVAAAAGPALFAKLQPGMWELSNVDGSRTPIRLCVGDLRQLARIQHRARRCSQSLLSDRPTSATFSYRCSAGEFGHSKLDFVTARNVRVETQGISGGLPFSYVAQARRVGECKVS